MHRAFMHIGFFACFHRIALSKAVVSGISPLILQVRVVLKTVVSLMGRFVACSARITADRIAADRHSHTDQVP